MFLFPRWPRISLIFVSYHYIKSLSSFDFRKHLRKPWYWFIIQTVYENRIYSLRIQCGKKYPDEPPIIQFTSRVNLPFVNQANGMVDPSKLPVLADWQYNSCMENVLVGIRRYVIVFAIVVSTYDSIFVFLLLLLHSVVGSDYLWFCYFYLERWHRFITASSPNLPKARLSDRLFAWEIITIVIDMTCDGRKCQAIDVPG